MGKAILIVDDSATMRQMIKRVLTLSGLDIGVTYEAGNGIAAFAQLGQHSIDLVMLDINMPTMNGVQFLKRLRDDPRLRDIPVIVVSTEGSETRLRQLLDFGARAVLRKPFLPEQARAALEPILGASAVGAAEDAPPTAF